MDAHRNNANLYTILYDILYYTQDIDGKMRKRKTYNHDLANFIVPNKEKAIEAVLERTNSFVANERTCISGLRLLRKITHNNRNTCK